MRPRYHLEPFAGEKAALLLDAAVLYERRRGMAMLLAPDALGRTYATRGVGALSYVYADQREREYERQRARGDLVEERPAKPAPGTAVGVVRIMGPLEQRATQHMSWDSDGYDAVAARFQSMLDDPRVGSVLMHIDSPGGDAAGCFEAVRRMRAAASVAGKPVFAHADELAASAAYALATVAEKIYLPPSGTVGSIGVISAHIDESKALENEGMTVTVVKSGARKAEFNSLEPLTKEAHGHMQELVDGLAGQFAELVAEGRGKTAKAWLKLEGAVAHGEDAVAKGLADGVQSFEETVAMAAAAAEERRTAMSNKEVNAALGLPEDAPQAETVEASKQAAAARDALLGATAKTTVPAALGALDAWKTKVEIADAHEQTSKASEEARRAAAMVASIDAAVEDGRLPPAKRGQLLAEGEKHGPEYVESHLALLDPVVTIRREGSKAPPTRGAMPIDAEMRAACKAAGMTVEEFKEWGPKADAYFRAQAQERGDL